MSFQATAFHFCGNSYAALLFNWHGRSGYFAHNVHELDPCLLSLTALPDGLAFNIAVILTKCLLIMTLSTLTAVASPLICITAVYEYAAFAT